MSTPLPPPSIDHLFRPTYAQIDLAALAHNYRQVRSCLGPQRKLLSVIKANAYGHSVKLIAPMLQKLGSDWFGVATVGEALELRHGGIDRPILVMGGINPYSLPHVAAHRLAATAYSLDILEQMIACGFPVELHLKIDTGMNRLGLKPEELERALDLILRHGTLNATGIFSHLSHADAADRSIFENQRRLFVDLCQLAEARLGRKLLRHLGNSGALLSEQGELFDMLRVGILLYGSVPSLRSAGRLALKPVLHLQSQIVQIKAVRPGERVGYDGEPQPRPLRLAIVPIGYADGYLSLCRKYGRVLCEGQFCPIVGNICMDMLMVDISALPAARVGTPVTLLGGSGANSIPALELAQAAGTTPYELFTSISERVPRLAVGGEA